MRNLNSTGGRFRLGKGSALAAVCMLLVVGFTVGALAARETKTVPTSSGDIRITPVTHGSLMLEFGGKVIHVDPWGRGDYSGLPKADVILITDIHGDHMDPKMVQNLSKEVHGGRRARGRGQNGIPGAGDGKRRKQVHRGNSD